ncbi:RDD family protein [Mangrovibacterium diazotrophicum]|uniref:Putative RDD family membrane protein YckC n=1 Tax=Mangrovibacterium diazotrophicum TaxID=1261403 RepID=A0A419VXG2_9BACT|nr:RDD family protein [Mangrovibacterium diazotrophicum]RKD87913.1 putative RDD family membrane protein YckC [Mangrovibacterium diazotrophicum]
MYEISLQTAQNTLLVQNKASVGERILATLLDVAVFSVYLMIGGIIAQFGFSSNTFWIIYGLPIYFYSLIMELAFNGQSLGKMVMKIKVVHQEGRQVPFSSYLLRWLLRIIDIYSFAGVVGICSILFSKHGQRLGDLAAKTLVVRLDSSTKFQNFSFNKHVSPEAQVVFAQASLMEDEDVEIIKEVLAYGKENGYIGKSAKMVIQVSANMKQKLSLTTELKPIKFLEQLLDDYYLIHK